MTGHLSYRQASELGWAISWRMGLLHFGLQLLVGALPLGEGGLQALRNFCYFLVLGFFPMVVRKALNLSYKSGFRIEVIRAKSEPGAPVSPFGADLG